MVCSRPHRVPLRPSVSARALDDDDDDDLCQGLACSYSTRRRRDLWVHLLFNLQVGSINYKNGFLWRVMGRLQSHKKKKKKRLLLLMLPKRWNPGGLRDSCWRYLCDISMRFLAALLTMDKHRERAQHDGSPIKFIILTAVHLLLLLLLSWTNLKRREEKSNLWTTINARKIRSKWPLFSFLSRPLFIAPPTGALGSRVLELPPAEQVHIE